MHQCGIFHISTAINIVLLISLIVLLAYRSSFGNLSLSGNDDKEWSRSVCIPCEEGEVLVDYRVTITQERQMCCYNHSEILDLMYSVIADEGIYQQDKEGRSSDTHSISSSLLRGTRVPKWWKNRVSAAHLFLNTSAINGINLPWVYSQDETASVLSDDVTVIDGRIKVSSGGLYFLYSVITIDNSLLKLQSDVNHRIQRQHVKLPLSGPELLFLRSHRNYRRQQTFFTSFICGSHILRRGDEISCSLSDPRVIHKAPYENYFGLFKL